MSLGCSLPCFELLEYGQDSPVPLFSRMLQDANKTYGNDNVDAVIISGDLVVHGLAVSDPTVSNWPSMMFVIQ